MSDSNDPKKTYTGSCMCGKTTYTVDLALPAKPVAVRCNCTLCTKSGNDVYKVAEADFHLKTPCSTAECMSSDNANGKHTGRFTLVASSPDLHRYFCKGCGVLILTAGSYNWNGQAIPHFAFNCRTLDQPQDGLDLSKFTYQYYNGLNDDFSSPKTDGPHPNGTT